MDWKAMYEAVRGVSYSAINTREYANIMDISELTTYLQSINTSRENYISPNVKNERLLLDMCDKTINNVVICQQCPGLSPMTMATMLINDLRNWYQAKGIAHLFPRIEKMRHMFQHEGRETDRDMTFRWVWATVYAHLCIISDYIRDYLDSIPIKHPTPEDLDEKLTIIVREAMFACSRYLGDSFTSFCYSVLFSQLVTEIRPKALNCVVSAYLRILNDEFRGEVPREWIYRLPA